MERKIERFDKFMKIKGLNDNQVTNLLEFAVGTIGKSRKEGRDLSDRNVESILNFFPELDRVWFLTGEGSMFKTAPKPMGIPFYDDVATIGGVNDLSADMGGVSRAAEYIDTGDWFRDATAAIRHYGDSMMEYPPGCILAIKQVVDIRLIIPGSDYVIETDEYRVTKRVGRGSSTEYITAYSTNPETYPNGRLIHEPFEIPISAIRSISIVLGYVVKKSGGTMVFSDKHKK